jgi:hypothetical protein
LAALAALLSRMLEQWLSSRARSTTGSCPASRRVVVSRSRWAVHCVSTAHRLVQCISRVGHGSSQSAANAAPIMMRLTSRVCSAASSPRSRDAPAVDRYPRPPAAGAPSSGLGVDHRLRALGGPVMSEYQYYEFLAVDRPLTAAEQAEVRQLSTRARITATTFTNEYHWGDFKGSPDQMMQRYYDAHLYLANWGTHRIMLRLPRTLLDPKIAGRYCVDGQVSISTTRDYVILDLTSEDEEEAEPPVPGRPGITHRCATRPGRLPPPRVRPSRGRGRGQSGAACGERRCTRAGHAHREAPRQRQGPASCAGRRGPGGKGPDGATAELPPRPR